MSKRVSDRDENGQYLDEGVLQPGLLSAGVPIGRHLQHGRALTFAQLRQEDDLPIGKLKRIMMGVGLVHVDLPKLSHAVAELTICAEYPGGLALHFLLEGELCTGKQTYGDVPVLDRSKATCS